MSPGVEAPGVAKDPEGGGAGVGLDGVPGLDLAWFPIWTRALVEITGVGDLEVSRLGVNSSVHSSSSSGEVSLNEEILIGFITDDTLFPSMGSVCCFFVFLLIHPPRSASGLSVSCDTVNLYIKSSFIIS